MDTSRAAICLAVALVWLAANAEAAQLPEPTALEAGWWEALSGQPGRDERFAAMRARLQATAERARREGNDELARLAGSVDEALQTYADWTGREPAAAADPPAVKPIYGIGEMLELSRELRRATSIVELQNAELAERRDLLDAQQQRLDDARLAYQRLEPSDPDRERAGWQVILERVRLATAERQLDIAQVGLDRVRLARDSRAELLTSIYTRLTVDAGERARLATRAAEVETQLDALRAAPQQADSLYGQALQDAQRAALELELAQSRLMLALPEAGTAEVANDALREAARAHQAQLAVVQERLAAWRAAAERALEAQRVEVGADGRSTEQPVVLDRVLRELGGLVADGAFLQRLTGQRLREETGWAAQLGTRLQESGTSLWAELRRWVSASLFEINETPVTILGLLRVVLILVVAWWVSRLLRHALDRVGSRRRALSPASVYTVSRLIHYSVLVIGFLIGLSSIGIDFTKLALLLSAVGIGLGFGLQAIFSNFISGLIILFEKSLKVGDFVELASGVQGEVKEINIRSTLITTNDNVDILVPNSEFVTGRVVNWTLRDVQRRIRIPFGVAYGSDKELVRKAGLEAAEHVPYTLQEPERRKPQVWLVGFGDSSLNFELVVWLSSADAVKRPAAVQAEYTWALESALQKHGIEIPFPQRDLHLRSLFGRHEGVARDWIDRLGGSGRPQGSADPAEP